MKYIINSNNGPISLITALTDAELAAKYGNNQNLKVHGTEVWSCYEDGEKDFIVGQYDTVSDAETGLLMHQFAQAMIAFDDGSMPIPDPTLDDCVETICGYIGDYGIEGIEGSIAAQSTPEFADALRTKAIEMGLLTELVPA